MQQVIKDASAVVAVDFLVDGNFAAPAVGTVKYTLFDNLGVAIGAQTDVNVTVDGVQTNVNITVAGTYNGKSLTTEYRSMLISATIGGKPWSFLTHYIITDMLPHSASPDDVRELLGVSHEELPDRSIDLVASYFELGDRVGLAALSNALGSGGRTAIAANRGVAAQAALLSLPSLRLRINQLEKSDAGQFQRFAGMDWAAIEANLRGLIGQAAVLPDAQENGTFIVVNTPTDPITGA